jgi:hypothetical protein
VRLPFPPGVEYDYMADPPADTLPLKWDKGFQVENDALTKAQMVLTDKIVGELSFQICGYSKIRPHQRDGRVLICRWRPAASSSCKHTASFCQA